MLQSIVCFSFNSFRQVVSFLTNLGSSRVEEGHCLENAKTVCSPHAFLLQPIRPSTLFVCFSPRHRVTTLWSIPVTSVNHLADDAISQTFRPLSPSLRHLPLTGKVHVPSYHLTTENPPTSLLQLLDSFEIRNRLCWTLRVVVALSNISNCLLVGPKPANPSSWQGTREGASPLREAAY